MDITTIWWVLAGVTVATELLTGTFYLLLIAIGMAFGAIAAGLGWSIPLQFTSAAVTAVGLALGWRLWLRSHPPAHHSKARVIGELDSGEVVNVVTWSNLGRARVQYRGTSWDAELQPGKSAAPGPHRIIEIRGNRLVVTPV
jgi:membrane protein implicated in regulation of membrane protease activity